MRGNEFTESLFRPSLRDLAFASESTGCTMTTVSTRTATSTSRPRRAVALLDPLSTPVASRFTRRKGPARALLFAEQRTLAEIAEHVSHLHSEGTRGLPNSMKKST